MELHTPEAKKTSESLASTLSADLVRILEAVRKQLEAEFEKRLETSIQEAERATMVEAEKMRDEAVANARKAVSEELTRQYEQSRVGLISEIRAELDQQFQKARQEWERDHQALQEDLNRWRLLAEGQSRIGESDSQTKCLQAFFDSSQSLSPGVAVYVGRLDGLALWKATDTVKFPAAVSRDSVDPDFYFRPLVIRGKTVAAICAKPPFKADSLDVLVSALGRAIEAFGMALQRRPSAPEIPPVLKNRAALLDEKAVAEARFTARLLVADIKLRHEGEMLSGREHSDLYARLKEPIEKARQVYRQRASLSVLAARDFFHELLVEVLADGVVERMGAGYPGPQVSQHGSHVQQAHLS